MTENGTHGSSEVTMRPDPLIRFLEKSTRRRFANVVRAMRDDVLATAYRVLGDRDLAENTVGKTPPFESVQELIERNIVIARREEEKNRYVEDLKKWTYVKIYLPDASRASEEERVGESEGLGTCSD